MAKGEHVDPRMMSVTPRIRYNTIGGVNGPLVILENVRKGLGSVKTAKC
jgi:V-type H+-transporting ATPase subunit B